MNAIYIEGFFSSLTPLPLKTAIRLKARTLITPGLNCPNFRVLSNFRKRHGVFFQDCFKQTVKLALGLTRASLGHISLDGSRFKANSSQHRAMSYARLIEQEAALSAELDTLIEQAVRCDQEEDKSYLERTGYELPRRLKAQKRSVWLKSKPLKKTLRNEN